MRYRQLSLTLLLLTAAVLSKGQGSKYLYYFDKDLNMAEESKAVFYGKGEIEDTLLKLMLYNSSDKHLIFIKRFTDSSLQTSEGFFTSFYGNQAKESEGYYEKGLQYGLWLRWDTSGNIIDSTTYDTGRVIAQTSLRYQPGGKLMEMKMYDVVKKTRRDIFYSDDMVTGDKTFNNYEEEDKVFTKTEIEAQFPGGAAAWTKYISHSIMEKLSDLREKDNGTCIIKFIVDKEGNISEVEALTLKGSSLARIAIEAIQNGPKWVPAMQNGRVVKAYRLQPVTVVKTK